MHWHLRKVQAGVYPTDTLERYPFFTTCLTVSAYKELRNNRILCSECYDGIHVPSIKARCEKIFSHSLIIGARIPSVHCHKCFKKVSTQAPACAGCFDIFTKFVFLANLENIEMQNLPDPLTIFITGENIEF